MMFVAIPELAGLQHGFDVVQVDHAPEAVATEHPVELGAEVTDHIQVRPVRFTVEVMVSDSPTLPLRPGVPLSVDAAILFLEAAQGKLLTVTIEGEGTWQSMVLERWPHSRTVVRGRSFSLGFKQVRIAFGLSITIPPRMPAPVARVGAPTEQDLGQQAATAGTPSSLLFQASDILLSILPGGG